MKKSYLLWPFLPCIVDVATLLFIFPKVIWGVYILSILLLGLVGLSFVVKKKLIQMLGIVSLVVFVVWFSVMGYYDYFPWFSTKVAVIVLIYFAVLFVWMKRRRLL